MMTTPYLLDTSAFRALRGDTLARFAAERSLLVSPFCFWETISHLDEPNGFDLIRANLMKFRHVRVLDDPEAETLANVGVTSLMTERISDDDLIYATLAALRDSASLHSFYSKHIRDSHGNVRTLSGCVSRAKDILRTHEERFLWFVRQIADSVRAGTSQIGTPWDLHRATVSLIDGWHIARCGQPLNENVRILRILYIYFAFVVLCARDHLAGPGALNDYEDARLCQHVRLDYPCTIVSGDGNQRRRLNEIFSLLEAVAIPQLEHSHQVLAVEEVS
jgi:hypothetical protein